MRVLWMIDSLGPGGAESLMLPLLRSLKDRVEEPRVCVLYVRAGNPTAVELEKLGIRVDLMHVRNLRDLDHIWRVFKYVHSHQPDIIHTQLETSDILGSLIGKILKIPTIATMHTLDERPLARKIKKNWRNSLRWQCLNSAARYTIAVSNFTRQHYLRLGFRSAKMITMYNGIDLSNFTPRNAAHSAKSSLFGIPEDSTVITTVAVLREPKGVQYMLQAFGHVAALVPNAYYIIAGDGDHRKTLEEMAQSLGIADRVIFMGYRKDIPEILAASDLFVFPTLQDALPTVLLEAMAAGLPIIASQIGGVPEIITHGANGLLISPASPSSLSEACLRILQDEQLAARLTAAGLDTVQRRFDVQQQASSLYDLYQKVVSNDGN